LLDLDALFAAIRKALIDLSAQRVVQPMRTVMALPGGMLFIKPALAGDSLATKLITQFAGNSARGLPTMQSTIVLMDPATGGTLAVMDGNWITALRTAVVSAIGVDCMTARTPKTVAMLGSGVLARTHALALRKVRDIRQLRVWSPNATNAKRCAGDTGGIACASAREAVNDADIICTVTNAENPVLEGDWIKPGAFVAAIGAPRPHLRELDDKAMQGYVVTDSREAAELESGDVILSGAIVHAEIGEILAGTHPPPPAQATVVFKALGQAVEDAVAARLVYESAVAATSDRHHR
jgi:thiomorpholine-carboxylate dehydrogenase